jgi:hypothetical protein
MEDGYPDKKGIGLSFLTVLSGLTLILIIVICSSTCVVSQSLDIPVSDVHYWGPFPNVSIAADPNEIYVGDCSSLTWDVTNAENVLIDPGLGSVELIGSISVCPESTTTYTLKACNGLFCTRDYVTLNVKDLNDGSDDIIGGERILASNNSDISISNVADGDRVPQILTLIGRYPSDLKEDIWVFVVAPNGLYYPQSINACDSKWRTPKVDGKWEVRVGFGQPEEVGEYYGLVLTVADQNASRDISDTLKLWCDSGVYTGWNRLPPGVTEVRRITVVRNPDIFAPAPNISDVHLNGEVSFFNISENDTVPFQMNIDGNCTSDLGGEIWVLVYPTNARWYPQSVNPCGGVHTFEADGTWRTMGTFGGEESNIGEPFDVVVVLANESASKKLDEKQKEWCEAGDYKGFYTIELPQGIEEKDRVRVYRK